MYEAADVIWVLAGSILVFFMQAGFTFCETGLTRAKNTGNVLMKNMVDFCISTLCYWLIGFGIMYAGKGPLIGGLDIAVSGNYDTGSVPLWCFVLFQTLLCAVTVTIVSGPMAERTGFAAYCLYSMMISLVVYPVTGHWIWGGGWLEQLGFHDFAGGAAIHLVGGLSACIGTAMVGPRIGKYYKKKYMRAIPGHNLTVCALGVFILWFGWFGLNGGMIGSIASEDSMALAGHVLLNTCLSGAASTVAAALVTWKHYGKPDVSMTFNGVLAGLVAISAGCDCVSPVSAVIVGFMAGVFLVFSVELFEKILHIDDPVGAISVHMVNGIWGIIAAGIFSNGGNDAVRGLIHGGGYAFLGIQCLGILATAAYVIPAMFLVFWITDKLAGLRVPQDVELDGLDIHEHGLASAYSGFSISDVANMDMDVNENTDLGEHEISKATQKQIDMAIRVLHTQMEEEGSRAGIYNVTIICRQSRFDQLKKALNDFGVTGITMTQVMGCGIQKGAGEKYRGVEMDATLLPKVKVEVVVGRSSVDDVIWTAKNVLYTGHVGDGKIFVFPVSRVVKVRTGEENFRALKDVE